MSDTSQASDTELPNILEALLLASDQPLSLDALHRLLSDHPLELQISSM